LLHCNFYPNTHSSDPEAGINMKCTNGPAFRSIYRHCRLTRKRKLFTMKMKSMNWWRNRTLSYKKLVC